MADAQKQQTYSLSASTKCDFGQKLEHETIQTLLHAIVALKFTPNLLSFILKSKVKLATGIRRHCDSVISLGFFCQTRS